MPSEVNAVIKEEDDMGRVYVFGCTEVAFLETRFYFLSEAFDYVQNALLSPWNHTVIVDDPTIVDDSIDLA